MFLTIVDQWNSHFPLLNPIDCDARLVSLSKRLQDGDVIDRLAITVVHLERLPICREAWSKTELIDFKPQSQERFHDESIHPTGRTRVPRPPTPANVGR